MYFNTARIPRVGDLVVHCSSIHAKLQMNSNTGIFIVTSVMSPHWIRFGYVCEDSLFQVANFILLQRATPADPLEESPDLNHDGNSRMVPDQFQTIPD